MRAKRRSYTTGSRLFPLKPVTASLCEQASVQRDKEPRTAAAASAVNRARLVHGDGVVVQVHLPHACVAILEMEMCRQVGGQSSWVRQKQKLAMQ